MNEEALKDAHSLFSNSGYNGDINEFQTLLSDNAEAFADSYGLFNKSGYSGSEDDYKLLLGLKKKDTSELQEAAAPEGTQDTPFTSEAGQSSLAQKTQDSLDERLSGYKDLSAEDKIAFDKEEELRPFYEAEGVDYDQFLYSNELEKERKEKQSKTRVKQTPEGIQAKRYLESVDENAFQANTKYHESKYQSVLSRSTSQEDFLSKVKSEGVDLNYIPLDGLLVDGQKVSYKELERNLYDNDFIDKLQEGGVDVSIKNPEGVESLKYLEDLAQRQIESGGQWGDVAESFLAGGLDLLVAGPLEIIEGIGASVSPAQRAMYMRQGGIMSSKVKEYTEKIRDNIRAYEEQGITKSLIAGNYSDAFFQGSNALAESTPLIMSMAMSSPLLAAKLGPKAAQSITLTGVGASSAGVKSLDLKKMRREGEISISDEALITNMILTGAAEAYFERATLGLINAGRKVIKMNKANPAELADGFVKGLGKSFGIEATSEGLTEVSNVVTDALTEVGTPESFGDFVSQISDAFIIGGLMGGGMHTMPYAFKAISDIGSLREDISAVFTFEDGNTREMKLKEARDFVKDKDIAQRIRNKSIDMDASITENGRNILNEIIYGYYAPDNVAAREGMFVKEKDVQDLVSKIEKADAPTPEDVSSIADALSEMETEGKKNKYNISKSTEATRARVGKFFKDNGIDIVDAVNDQDASMSTITETVESNSIDSVEEYNAVKKQIEDGKRKPTIVKSQDQNGIKIKGENVQKSSITQGKFKSVSSARNAIKEFEVKQEANKNAKPTTDQIAKANNKAFIKTKKEGLDKVPKKVIDSGEYHIISPDRSGITKAELVLRMENTKADLEASGATVYTITEVVDGKSRKSFLVTNTTNAAALGTARNLQVESVFSAKDGILNTDGSVVPLDNSNLSGPEARQAGDISIVNVNGKKTSIYKGVDKSKTTFGKSFDSNNIHKLDESDPNYDKDLLDGVPSDRKRALGFAFKLLSSIGGLKVTVVRNSENMYNQLKALGHPNEEAAQGASSNAFFRGQDKSIYINLENVKGNTLFHEIVHPLVDFMKQNSPETYAKIEKEVSEGKVKRRYIKDGRRMKGTYLEWAQNHPFYSTLSKEAQIEEAFAEMIGDAAYGHFVDRNSRLGRLRDLISEILSKIGVTVTDQPEKVSLDDLNLAGITKNLAGALVNGRSINVGGVDFEVGDIEADVAPRFSLDVVDKRTGIQYAYDKNSEAFEKLVEEGYITEGMTIEDFKDKAMMVHSPDAMFSGEIIDRDGTPLVEGKGGLLYAFKFNEEGYFWASTDNAAEKMTDQLNSMLKDNGGKIYMALTTAPENKLLSNTAASRGILNLFSSDNFISKLGINKAGVYNALIEAANTTEVKTKVDKNGKETKKTLGLDLKLGAYRASNKFREDVLQKIWSKLDKDNSSFDDRKTFSDKFLTFVKQSKFEVFTEPNSKQRFVDFIKSTESQYSMVEFNKSGTGNITSLKKAIISIMTEPSLRGEQNTNKVYAVLEIDGPVKPLKTDSYESYGTSIVSAEGNRVKIHRLDDRNFWYDFAKDPETGEPIGNEIIGRTEKGKPIYRRSQIMPSTAGVSMMPLKFQAPNVEEVVWEESKIGKGDRAITNRNDAVQKAANDYFARDIEYEEYLKIVKDNSLIKPITEFMEPASLSNVEFAIGKKSISKKTGESMIDVPIEEGREVGVRLDINAYVDKNTWVVTVHDSKVKRDGSLDVGGSPISYTNVARIKNVTFASNPGAALNIARGRSKATIARIMGNWSPLEGDTPEARAENAKSIIVEVMNDPSWVQVGMNPFRHSYFYDRLDGMPVVKANEVVQIGGLVYAKNAEKVSPLDERFRDSKSGLRFQAPTLFNEPNPESADIARMYMNNNSGILGIIPDAEVLAVSQLDEVNSKMIADAYENLVDDPTNPGVRAAYEALADEIGLQYESILERGYNVEIWEGEGEPYANSAEMIEDVRDNKHMYIFGTEGGFGEAGITQAQRDANAMLADTPYTDVNGKQLVVNDLFRFVHDFFGHTEIGNGFGPVGEENAWLAHARMFSKPARLAMTTETRGQNSWVNFNESLRREDGSVPKRGDDDYIPLSERPFADQKMGLMAEEISYPKDLKYQVPTGGQTNVYKSGLAAIAWDIGMSVIKADYKAGKYITGIKDKDRAYDIRLSTLIGKPFGTHSNEEIKEIMVRSKSELNRQLFRVDQNSKALKRAIKNTDYTAQQIDDLLHNYNEIKAMEDGDVKKALVEMRKHIDLLSRTLIDEGLVQGQTQFTIDSNMGVYVSRSYKQFQDKGWEQTDNDIIKRVKDFLYKEAKKDNPNATEEELTGIVKLAYRKLKENKDFDYFSSKDSNLAGLSRVNSIFKEKKLIPEEIREFWGEIDNPLYNYSSTVRKMAQDVSAERMYKELMEVGDGKFLSNEQTAEFYNEITGNKWGSLNGKFVDEQMFSVINQIDKKINSEGFGKVQAAYMKLVLFNKKMKTIYNIGTHAKNVIGNTAFAMMNGHINFDAVSVYENGKTAIRAVKTMKDDDVKALYDKLVGLGVVNSSASLQEIRGIAEDLSRNDFDFNDFTSKGTTFSKKVKQAPKKFDNWITELYQKEDDVWKIFGFLAEKGRYIDAGLDVKTAEELAAKNIRNSYPNYDRIPRVIRALGRSPLVGSFVAFQAEAVRNVKNTIQLGFQEISSDNPKIRAIGAQRIAGTVVTSTLMGSLQIQTAQLLAQSLGFLSEDEETSESKLIRILMPIWDATGNLVVWNRGNLDTKQFKGQSTPDRYFDYINFSSTSGIGYIKDVFRLAFTDIDTVAGKESVLRVAEKIYEPFLGKEMTAGIVQEALANRNSKIFKETDSNLEKVWSIISYVGNKVQPGITKSGARITKAALDMEKDLVTGYEVLALLGIRISRINVNKNISYKGYFINKEMVESVGRDAMKDESTVRAKAREDEDFDNRLNQLADVISSASYQGLSGEDIRNILRYKGDESTRSGISEAVIMEAYNRHLLRYDPDVINVE